ncbi:hypothetical protein [Arthrobacter sp. MMS18-M83]|uniref:hypothetical protein n=1 Tax=Arthrobacter sp. MMS18-M83 TaxID=2996261 RepID=UPI00227BA522|nr:hypothetical protein [Arthrobacter sp. MMS18-M83]WAH96206.1 hypothetical protein OW521_17525 [Arthrobacter sp. MMS18-M83]
MAERHRISFPSVARIWRRWKIQPHRIETFKFSTDPALESKLGGVVGLYMSPPETAVVVNIVGIFFGDITRQCLKRGAFSSVKELEETMERYIENYNQDAKPFTWTKSSDHLLGKMKRKQAINTEH